MSLFRLLLGRGPLAAPAPPSGDYAWRPNAFPHSPAGLLVAYTDFGYQGAAARAALEAFLDTHADKVTSQGEPAGGYQPGLAHGPYILTFFVYSDGTNQGSLLTNSDQAWTAWAPANGYTVEEGYLHYPAGAAMPGGGTATGNGSAAERLIYTIPNYPPDRWVIHPGNAGRRAFEAWRAAQILANAQGSTTYTPEFMYVDEATTHRFDVPAATDTLEYNPANSTQFYSDVVALVAAVRAGLPAPVPTWGYQLGTASYTNANTIALIDAGSLAAQFERGFDPRTGNSWPGSSGSWAMDRIAAGAAIEATSPQVPTDAIAGGGGVYASDPMPATAASLASVANARLMAAMWCIGLLYVDPVNAPGRWAVNFWNGAWSTPDKDTGGMDYKWITLLEAPVGPPVEPYSTLLSGATDPLGQPVNVSKRAFASGAIVVYRMRAGYGAQVFDDTAAYPVPLPASSAPSGKWQRTKLDNALDAPLSTIALRPTEGVILFPDAT